MIANADDIARTCLRPIRGCATDNQYCDVLARVTAALEEAWRDGIKLTKPELVAMLADQRKLDAVVHVLGIEDSDADPAEKVAALQAELDEATLARGRLRLWLEFIHLNSNDAKEFTAEALVGNHVPDGFA